MVPAAARLGLCDFGGTNYARGYVMRIGPRYMDARDPAGLEKVDVRSPVFAPRPRCLPGL